MCCMKRQTIRNHKDFIMPSNTPKIVGHYFVIKARPALKPGDARYGLVVPKSTFKLAVKRNRVKRVLRDWIAFNETLMRDDLDYVFIAFSSILDCTRDIGRKKIKNALRRLAKLYDKQNNQSQ